MKKHTILITIFLVTVIKTNAQELTCEDFKIGKFYIPQTQEISKYTIEVSDSIIEMTDKRDLSIKKWIVVREKNTQTEWKNGIGNGVPEHEVIEWIDDCTYRLTYDSSKMELSENKKWVNENKGIVVTKTKIENNCLYYKATMTTNEGQKISQNGIICKE
ncbi:hypothetical protein V1T75_00560 [Tenacibaculum sp. FZY0031]|uniref:hypothetical protein n=1 Tax=Tenacibaculum sp. FZY0031 TaxID=3116648 RepID=UPI002EC84CAE|nr:hypothetical protein [Tenacibaculum sp. FZY0031]